MIKKIGLATLFQILIFVCRAQDTSVEMADTFRRDGKIYVVVAVLLTILAGIIIYLVRLDRKISRLEKNS